MSKAKQFSNPDLPLTPPTFYILLSLAVKQRHGYDIMKQVKYDSNGKLNLGPGTLYGAIKRLLEEKLIIEAKNQNRRRKYYKLTDKGNATMNREIQRYRETVILVKKRKLLKPAISKLTLSYV